MVSRANMLPRGQKERADFPRFGLGRFANRFPANPARVRFEVRGDVGQPLTITALDEGVARHEQMSDFHCVTSWSVCNLRWSGVRFADFHKAVVVPRVAPADDARLVVFRGEDGYRSIMPLDDLLADDVLLADSLEGRPLGIDHGAPLRLVAPAHYGYKNVKHIVAIEYWRDRRNYHFAWPYPSFMDHPRGRVAFEERGTIFPAWMLRGLYSLLIPSAVWRFARALRRHEAKRG